MRLLFIHSDPFSYRVTENTHVAEPIAGDLKEEVEVQNALVVFTAAEKPDEKDIEDVTKQAAKDIIDTYKKVNAEWVILYPYSHLSNNLASPDKAVKIIKKLKERLGDIPTVQVPFGWYKAFNIHGRGHPLSELSRMIEVGGAEVDRSQREFGREHPVAALNQRFREIFLKLGLDEMINPAIVETDHVYRQYGPEAPLILDRVYYLAGLDRADIGLSKSKEKAIKSIVPDFDRGEELKTLLREYKEAQIEADDFLEEMAKRLKITGEQAARVLDEVFPEFRELKPVVANRTLRSHMTSNWFPVLEKLQKKRPPPIRIFSVGSRFRREQRQDPHHLFESTSASAVIMAEDFTIDDGKQLVREMLRLLGFRKCSFRVKEVASRYYEPETDTEVFVNYEGKDIEVGNLGFYAPAALESYGLEAPVFNIGFGVERIAMMLSGGHDLRALVYPQFYEEASFTDEEMAKLLRCECEPKSGEVRKILPRMILRAAEEKDREGPAEAELFNGPIGGKLVRVTMFNWDEGKPLMSMAALNEVFVQDGNIYGMPKGGAGLPKKFLDIYRESTPARLKFLDMLITGFAARVEEMLEQESPGPLEERWKIAKRPNQINLHIPDVVYDYVMGLQKNIRVGGPLFFGLRAEVVRPEHPASSSPSRDG